MLRCVRPVPEPSARSTIPWPGLADAKNGRQVRLETPAGVVVGVTTIRYPKTKAPCVAFKTGQLRYLLADALTLVRAALPELWGFRGDR